MSELSDNIFALRNKGYTYNQIVSELKCSKGTVAYHLGEGQKEKSSNRQQKRLSTTHGKITKKIDAFSEDSRPMRDPLLGSVRSARVPSRLRSDKIGDFQRTPSGKRNASKRTFEWDDVVGKFGEKPVCYLTGAAIDYDDPQGYEFDHIVPRALGGTNSLDNLGLTTRQVNRAKGHMSVEEFVDMCTQVAKHHGTI